jgi:hypothetical protein
MIYLLMQRHCDDGGEALGALAWSWYRNWYDNVNLFSYDGCHPEEQVKFIKRLVKDKRYQGKLNYVLATANGLCTVRWLGTSNGYYSEGVSFEESP